MRAIREIRRAASGFANEFHAQINQKGCRIFALCRIPAMQLRRGKLHRLANVLP